MNDQRQVIFSQRLKILKENNIYYENIGSTQKDYFEIESELKINIKDFNGNLILLNFWATWCPPCRKEIPDFVKFKSLYSNNVEILGIDNEDAEIETIKTKSLVPLALIFNELINYVYLLRVIKILFTRFRVFLIVQIICIPIFRFFSDSTSQKNFVARYFRRSYPFRYF